jgi:hypothetical protein
MKKDKTNSAVDAARGGQVTSVNAVLNREIFYKHDVIIKQGETAIEIALPGTVLRSYNQITAFRFPPINQMIKSRFQKVIDDERERQQSNPKSK